MTTTTSAAPAGAGLRALGCHLAESDGWAGLRAALSAGQSGTIDGAWGSSAALAAATLAADAPGTLLVVVPNPADADPWANDLHSLFGTRPAVFERVGRVARLRQQREARLNRRVAASPPPATRV